MYYCICLHINMHRNPLQTVQTCIYLHRSIHRFTLVHIYTKQCCYISHLFCFICYLFLVMYLSFCLISGSLEAPDMICEECGKAYCFSHSSAHPNSNCEEYEKSIAVESSMNKVYMNSISKACPGCALYIEKSGEDKNPYVSPLFDDTLMISKSICNQIIEPPNQVNVII
jgi:hypothetical protein